MPEPQSALWASQEEQEALADQHGGEAPQGHASLSYSRLSTFHTCGERYRLQHVVQTPVTQHGSALAGTAVHTTIERMLEGGWWNNPDLVEVDGGLIFLAEFERLVEEAGGPDALRWGGYKRVLYDEDTGKPVIDPETGEKVKVGENYPWFCKTGPTFVKRAGAILRRDAETGLHVVETSIERRVSAWLDGPGSTLITGKIDVMLLADDEGHPRIRDWKTGTHIEPMQLANYAWLLANMEDPNRRVRTGTGEIAYLRGQTADKWIRSYDLEAWMPIVPRLFRDMVKALDAEVFPLVPSSWCGSCWVKEYCEYGKTLPE